MSAVPVELWSAECGHYRILKCVRDSGAVRYRVAPKSISFEGVVYLTMREARAAADMGCRRRGCGRTRPILHWIRESSHMYTSGEWVAESIARMISGRALERFWSLHRLRTQGDRKFCGYYETLKDAQENAAKQAARLSIKEAG